MLQTQRPRSRRWLVYSVLTFLGMLAMVIVGVGFATRVRPAIGLSDQQLSPCPATPNCVCSVDGLDAAHYVEPFRVAAGARGVIEAIASLIRMQPRASLVSQREDYLHAEFTSRLLRFVDDVEFHHLPHEGSVHVRSASRVGKSDLGVNRRRVEALRLELARRGVLSD